MTIAKVDATANDVPDEIQGFPTIKLYPAGGKGSPIEYSGDRSVEDLAKFVKEKGKYGIDVSTSKAAAKDDDVEMTDAAGMGKAAEAATGVAEKAKSVASEASEAVKTAVADSDDHDEL